MPMVEPEYQHPVQEFAHRTVDFRSSILVMAVVNRTPDSFYDDGASFALDAAVSAARRAIDDGADWVDVGGVPFAPGPELPPEEEAARVVPVIAALRKARTVGSNEDCSEDHRAAGQAFTAILSADTFQPSVAEQAIAAGADVINDTTGLHHHDLGRVVAAGGAHLVITHSLASPRTPVPSPQYDDVVAEVRERLLRRIDLAVSLGVPEEKIIVDPGHDLNKNTLHSLELTRRFGEIASLGFPALAAVSNKDFIGEALGQHKSQRLAGSLAAAQVCVMNGARILRMHQVGPSVSAVRMTEAIMGWREPVRLEHNLNGQNRDADRSPGPDDGADWTGPTAFPPARKAAR
ncbi:dihydropteroate synthase [Citricoccus sp. GCM10030269]|uniref:dihydropteroate synthase n=1 Tax=Citricoccus sp. GCM10030269 TaxID=3273388 RepID=UPI003619E768